MCGSNLIVRSSSFIYLTSFVWKTRLSPPGGGVIEDSWVGGWALGVRAARQRGESPFLPVLDAILHYLWLYGSIIQIMVTESVFDRLVTRLVTQSSENGFKRREFYNFNSF